jgi:hypothetical protein
MQKVALMGEQSQQVPIVPSPIEQRPITQQRQTTLLQTGLSRLF